MNPFHVLIHPVLSLEGHATERAGIVPSVPVNRLHVSGQVVQSAEPQRADRTLVGPLPEMHGPSVSGQREV